MLYIIISQLNRECVHKKYVKSLRTLKYQKSLQTPTKEQAEKYVYRMEPKERRGQGKGNKQLGMR